MQTASGLEGCWAGGRGGRVLMYSGAEICPDFIASTSLSSVLESPWREGDTGDGSTGVVKMDNFKAN